MAYKVQLIYFRQTGKYLTNAEVTIDRDAIAAIWKEVDELRRLGSLPGLRPGAGRDLVIVVDVPDHPDRVLHLVMPPQFDEDDLTPPHVTLEEARTTTRDVVKVDLDAEPEADTVVQEPNEEK
jgi:hypothetical protein